jgi:hypothetical protein
MSHKTGEWFANIAAPRSHGVMATVTATLDEGESVVIVRAKVLIDAEEDKPK